MDKKLLAFTIKSAKRRFRDVIGTCVAAFLAVFFVTGILLFEENMFEWQVASNKERFGNWFVMEANVRSQSSYLVNYEGLTEDGEAFSAVRLCDEDYNLFNCYIGYMSPEFLEIGCIEPVQGRMPAADNEIAMDYKTLARLGITSPKVGQTVTVRYYEENEHFEDEAQRSQEFQLVGILENYTNVWCGGRNLPGAVVTKERYEQFGNMCMSAYIYKLKETNRHADHKAIYEELSENVNVNLKYNSYVYDYEEWGTKSVYDYMYLLIMFIAIAALTYQLLSYRNSRRKSYELMRKLGATKSQVVLSAFVENVLILLPSEIIGIICAILVGRLVCFFVEWELGIGFYYVSFEIIIKGILVVLVSVIVAEILGRFVTLQASAMRSKTRPISKAKTESKSKSSSELKPSNVVRTISFRLTKANKVTQNLSIRLFLLLSCIVIIICGRKIYIAHSEYSANRDNVDLMGVAYVDGEYTVNVPYYVYAENTEDYWGYANDIYNGKVSLKDIEVQPVDEQIDRFIDIGGAANLYYYTYDKITIDEKRIMLQLYMAVRNGRFYRKPDANVTVGLTQDTIDIIQNVVGVESIDYATFESQRAWTWEGMSFDKMGYTLLMQEKKFNVASPSEYSGRYLFATEYVKPTEQIYTRLSKYIDTNNQDYEAFARGEQVIVFKDTNPYGEYDDTLQAGTTINYHYYNLPFERYGKVGKDIFAFDRPLMNYTEGKLWEEYSWFDDDMMVNILLADESKYIKPAKTALLKPCVQTKAAAVIYLTEDIKKELSDLIVRYGYYTAIASNTLAENACDKQNELMEELVQYAGLSELPDSCKAKVTYNQLAVKYNLLASISATDNILTTYCQENCIDYKTFAAANEQYRTNLINVWLQCGITIIAVMVVNILICAVVASNRLETRRNSIQLLIHLGATKKDVRKVFMLEVLREDMWCVFTMPVVMVVQYLVISKGIKKDIYRKGERYG